MAGLTLVASAASTAPTPIDDVVLGEPQGAEWDADGNDEHGSGGPCFAREGFSPAVDVENDFSNDVFGGGLLLLVNAKTFGAGIETGNLRGSSSRWGHRGSTG